MANTLGKNIVFPIYNADGTPFHDIVVRKSTYDSTVMALDDKISCDVYYKDNTLTVTMHEYIEYKRNPNDENEIPTKFVLVNPPTIVRERVVSNSGETNGMTKYSFVFYHPMCQLANLPFTDVAVSDDDNSYLSESNKFSWIGTPDDYIDKLNKNLQGTQWIVEKSTRFPNETSEKLSDVLSFDNNSIADALKTFYDTWKLPYIVENVSHTEQEYSNGKRYKIILGLPSEEVYENSHEEQVGNPFVFREGQGLGLKNNSKTPRNNKIITRISSCGSDKNIPYGYPQIKWNGESGLLFTYGEHVGVYNNVTIGGHTFDKVVSFPIYKGILNGEYVELIKHPFTRTMLMPSIYRETLFNKISFLNEDGTPNTHYDPDLTLIDYYDAIDSEDYHYVNHINQQAPSYEHHQFEDTKPELGEAKILNAYPLKEDLTADDKWIDDLKDKGDEFKQSFFKIKLPILSFDLYACAAITEEMQINMRSGACRGCTFPIQIDWEDYKSNFYDKDGNFLPNGPQRNIERYPKSNLSSIEVVLKKENSTFGTIMPNIYQNPKGESSPNANDGDSFVILGISLPESYIKNAEGRLDNQMKSYMLENNVYYYDYPIKFDEHFLATHTHILSQIHPNSIIRFMDGEEELNLSVKQISIKYGESPLPQYNITLTDNIEVVLNSIGKVQEDVDKMGAFLSILRESYSRNVWAEIAKKLSKTQNDTAQGFITFLKGLQIGNQFVSGLLGEGGVFRKDADGKTYIEADRMYVRMKAYFDNVEIKDYHHAQGNRMVTSAGTKITRVEDNGSYYRCYFRASDGDNTISNDFVIGDMAYCNVTNIIGGELSQHSYWRLVIGKDSTPTDDEHYIDLSKTTQNTIGGVQYAGYMSGSDEPLAQDNVIQLGNVNDSTRRGAIIEYASGADSPSYKIYQNIGNIGNAVTLSAKRTAQYTLDGKEMISLGYNSQTGKAYMNVYGDTFIGDRDGSTYIQYDSQSKELKVKAKIEATSTIDGQSLSNYIKSNQNNFDDSELRSAIQGLQEQIDGEIDTWFFNVNPSDTTEPELTWKNTDIANNNNAERLKHLGDIYYNNSNGYAWRYSNTGTESNPVFSWVEISDSAVIRALANAAAAQSTADSKITTYTTWNSWIVGGTSKLQVNDMFIPTQDTPQGGTTYKSNKVYRCTNASTPAFVEVAYTDDTKINSYINEIIYGTATSGSDLITAAAAQRAIMGALNGGTTVDGGLVLTSLIGLRQKNGNNNIMWAGVSGQYNNTPIGQAGYAKGNGIAIWVGGNMVDKEMLTDAQINDGWNTHRWARTLFRFDGSGYEANGNISWDKEGGVTIRNIQSLYDNDGSLMNLNRLTELTNMFHSTLAAPNNTLYIFPQNAFSEIKIVHPSAYTIEGTDVLNMTEMDDRYITKEIFYKIFSPVFGTNGNLENLQVRGGLWTNSYISALGQNSSQGGGSGTSYNRLDSWASYDNSKAGWVLSALLGNDLNSRVTSLENGQIEGVATQEWVQQQGYLTELSAATTNALGAIKIGYSANGKNYPVLLDNNNRAYVNVPWTDTTYTIAGLMGSSAKGSTTQPIYWDGSAFVNTSYTLGKSVPSDAKFTDTTYSANNGVGLSGTTFYNSGVRAVSTNGNYLRVNTNGTNADLTIPHATSSTYVYHSGYNGSVYVSNDTHILYLGYLDVTNYGNTTLMISSGFWGNQHNSVDLITISNDWNTNAAKETKSTVKRVFIGGLNERKFYFKNETNGNTLRVHIAVYVTGGNGYGNWYISIPNSNNGAKWNTSGSQNIDVSSYTEVGYGGKINYANSATKLQTPRTINGTSFDGSANITTANWGTARNISIADSDSTNTGSAVSVNGSAAVTLKLPSTIKATLSGNAATATTASKLSTVSKTAWGQTFWTSGGVPTSISGALSSVTNITMSGYIKIGDAYLTYDSTNNAIRVSANADGTGAANFYALGGVSALGADTSGSGGSGTSYNRLDTWSSYDSTKSGWVLSALLGNDLHTNVVSLTSRVRALEDGQIQGIATQDWVEQQGYLTSLAHIHTLTIGSTTKSVSANGTQSFSLSEIGAAASGHTHSVKINGTTKTITSGTTVDLGTYLTAHQSLADYATKTWVEQKGYLTNHQDISGKADKATTLAGYGITDAYISNGAITLGTNTITPITSLAGYATEDWVTNNYLGLHAKADDSDKLDGYDSSHFANAADVVTLQSYFASGIANNADKVDQYHVAAGGFLFRTIASVEIDTADIDGDYWYIHFRSQARWHSTIEKVQLSSNYDDVKGVAYIDIPSYNNGFRAFTTTYKGCNILEVAYKAGNDGYIDLYAKMRKPTSAAKASVNLYATFSSGTLEIIDSAPTNVTFTALTPNAPTNVKANTLATPRTLWGQSFNGSGNVSGAMSGVTNINSLLYLGTNVGIGVSNPTEKLEVAGNIQVSCNIADGLKIKSLDSTYNRILFIDSTGADKAAIHYFHADMWNNPSANTLNLQSPIVSLGYWDNPTVYVNSDNRYVGIRTIPQTELDVNGTIHSTTGIYTEGYVSALGQNTSSDERLKDVQGDVYLPIDMLANAPSKAFVWKGNKALGAQVGTIAQYWQKHLPQVVHDNNGYLAMQYDVAALLGVISVAKKVKSHEERIAELEREIEMLNQELETLKN